MKAGAPGHILPYGGTIYPINLAWAATFDDELVLRAAGEVGATRAGGHTAQPGGRTSAAVAGLP